MKKSFFIVFFSFLVLFCLPEAKAQFKIHSNGHVSLGGVAQNYGVQIQPSGFTYFKTTINTAYSWATSSMVNHVDQLHWMVATNAGNDVKFWVTGYGNVWAMNQYLFSNNSHRSGSETIEGADAINILGGLRGYYFNDESSTKPEEIIGNENIAEEAVEGIINDLGKRRAGLSAEELNNVFPESVRTNPQANLGIDYASVIAILVSAVNEQQTEIEQLRHILEENELLKP